jgi:hypothetical protein
MDTTIQKRIAELEAKRDNFIVQANLEVAAYNGSSRLQWSYPGTETTAGVSDASSYHRASSSSINFDHAWPAHLYTCDAQRKRQLNEKILGMTTTKSTSSSRYPISYSIQGQHIRVGRRLFLRAGARLAILAVLSKSVEIGRVYAATPSHTYGSAPYGRISYYKFLELLYLPVVHK